MLGIFQNLKHSPTMLANTKYDVVTYMTTCGNFVLNVWTNLLSNLWKTYISNEKFDVN
jgi:hypothetical protein